MLSAEGFAPVFQKPIERNRLLALYLDLDRAVSGNVQRINVTLDVPLPSDSCEALIATPPSQPSLFGAISSRDPLLLVRWAEPGIYLFRDLTAAEPQSLSEGEVKSVIAGYEKRHWYKVQVNARAAGSYPVHNLINVGTIPADVMLESGSTSDFIRNQVKRGRLHFASLELEEIIPSMWAKKATVLAVRAGTALPNCDRAQNLFTLAADCVIVTVTSGAYGDDLLDDLAKRAESYQAVNIVLECSADVDLQWLHALRNVPPILWSALAVPRGATFQ